MGGGARYDRAAWRDMPRGGARATERNRFCSSDAQAIDAVKGSPTPCGCGGECPLYYMASCVSRSLRSVAVRG